MQDAAGAAFKSDGWAAAIVHQTHTGGGEGGSRYHGHRPARLMVHGLHGEAHPGYPPGIYKIIADTFATDAVDPESSFVDDLFTGVHVHVVEVVVNENFRRIRARIAQPKGWITLLRMSDGLQYVEKVDVSESFDSKTRGREPILPPALSALDYWAALDHFRRADCDRNGLLEINEFSRFVCSFLPFYARAIDLKQLYARINRGSSTGINPERFLAWVYSVPSINEQASAPCSPTSPKSAFASTCPGTPTSSGSGADPKSPTSPKNKGWKTTPLRGSTCSSLEPLARPASRSNLEPLSPKSPGSPSSRKKESSRPSSKGGLSQSLSQSGLSLSRIRLPPLIAQAFADRPLALEISFGPDFDFLELASKFVISCKHRFGNLVEVHKRLMPVAKGMTSVVVRLGTGITMWNQATMQAFSSDPFLNHTKVDAWVKSFSEEQFPLLIRVMNR